MNSRSNFHYFLREIIWVKIFSHGGKTYIKRMIYFVIYSLFAMGMDSLYKLEPPQIQMVGIEAWEGLGSRNKLFAFANLKELSRVRAIISRSSM